MPNHLTTCLAGLLAAGLSFGARAQDRRTVVEPSFPGTCTALAAQLQTSGFEPSSETAFDTARIQAALNGCASGKSVELVRSGANDAFLIGPITLPAGVGLVVDGGITVFASRNPADYQITGAETCGTVGTLGNGCKNLITIAGAGSSIMGYGVIDGRGQDKLLVSGVESAQSWWDVATAANGNGDQNNFVLIQGNSASSFTLYKITLRNPAMFHVVWKGTGLTAWGVKIATPYTARNTDGIDPGGTDITIASSYLSTGDDQIAITASSASAYITLRDLEAYTGHGISIGSYTKGGLNAMLVDHVNVSGGPNESSSNGIRIKSAQDRGGLVKDVTYQNMCVKDEARLLVLTPFYATVSGTLIPQFQNIALRNVHFLTEGKVDLEGFDASHPTTLTFDNVVFDHLTSSDLSPAPQYTALTIGPGAVYPSFLQSIGGTGVTVAGTAPATNTTAYDCSNAFPPLAGELYLSTPGATNQRSLSFNGPATFTLEATVQPTVSQVSYGAWTGKPLLTAGVNFLEGGTVVGTGSLGANGTLATATLTNVGGGTHTYVARYAGDANYPAFTFGTVTVTVNSATQAASTTELTAPSAATYGSAVTLTADVTSAAGTPAGTVSFSADGNSLGSAQLANGAATLEIAALVLAPGNHQILASYSGNTAIAASASASQAFTVSKATLPLTLSVPAGPVAQNVQMTLSASIAAPANADGTVTFFNGAAAIGTVPLSGNQATLRVTPGAVGPLSISATYSGGATLNAASAAAQTVTVVEPFVLSVASPTVTMPGSVAVTIAPRGGFTGSVDLTCASSSAAIHCSVSQPSVTLGAAATVTVTVSGAVAAAKASWPSMLPALFLVLPLRLRRKRKGGWLALLALLGAACSGGSPSPAATTITITARAGQASSSTQVTVQ